MLTGCLRLTLNQRVVGSSPTGLTCHIWDLDILQTPYIVAYGQRFGRDFTESAAHFGAYLLSAHLHLPRRWAASTPLACRRRVTHGPHRVHAKSASYPHVVRIHSTCPLHACLIVKERFAPRNSSGSREPWRRLWHIDVCLSECTEDEYSRSRSRMVTMGLSQGAACVYPLRLLVRALRTD